MAPRRMNSLTWYLILSVSITDSLTGERAAIEAGKRRGHCGDATISFAS